MTTRTIAGIIAASLAMTGVILGNMFLIMMIGEINRKREDGNLVSYFGFTFPRLVRIVREYRRSYPEGRFAIYALAALTLQMVGLVTAAVCFGIIG